MHVHNQEKLDSKYKIHDNDYTGNNNYLAEGTNYNWGSTWVTIQKIKIENALLLEIEQMQH